MTPKEKAIDLVGKYTTVLSLPLSKEFAIIAINEILLVLNEIDNTDDTTEAYHMSIFYNKVKTKIKKL